jgi:hypothetical protein
VAIAFALPFSPLGHTLGFTHLRHALVGVIIAIIPRYLLVLERLVRLARFHDDHVLLCNLPLLSLEHR